MNDKDNWIWLVPIRAYESFVNKDIDCKKITAQILESRINPNFPDNKEFVDVFTGVDYVLPKTPETQMLKEEIELIANNVIGKLKVVDMWCGVLEKGQSTPFHRHSSNGHLYPEEYWSGVVYLDPVNKDCRLCLYGEAMNAFSMVTKIEPAEGKIILFNSFVPHMTERHTGDRPRVCVSFNLHPINPNTNIYPDMSPWSGKDADCIMS